MTPSDGRPARRAEGTGWQDAPMHPASLARLSLRLARSVRRRLASLQPLAYLPRPPRRSGARPRLGLVGFFGHGNYGDELFVEVFREHLGEAFELDVVLDPRRPRLVRWLGAAVRRCDAILIGGGDLASPWSFSRYWDRALLTRPTFIAGIGVPTSTVRKALPSVVGRMASFMRHPSVRFIGARDAESAKWITANLAPATPVHVAPDLVCALTLPRAERPAGRPIFGVAVRSRRQPDDLSHVRRLCARARELGYDVRLIVLATGAVRGRDEAAVARLDLPDAELISTDDLAAISRAVGECSVFASMKFHGVVVATMYGVPTIALMPTAKTRNFLRGIGRLDLLSIYSDPDLPGRLTPDLQPIAAETVGRLRSEGVAHLADLRNRIEATIGG